MSDNELSQSRLARFLSRLRALAGGGERERLRRDLLLGFPAALCAVAAIVAGLWMSLLFGREITGQYRLQAWKARQAGAHATARLCYERLVREDAGDSESLFGLAEVLAEMGEAPSALELLDRLAPPDATGYAPAHLALGRQLLATSRPSAPLLHAAEQHLLRALESQPDLIEAQALLGRLYASAGRWELAHPRLAAALKNSDELALLMAQVTAALGKPEDARNWAKRSVSYWAGRAQAQPADAAARLAWAQALLALDDFSGALAVLERGIQAIADAPALRQAAAGVCAAWIERLVNSASPDTGLAVDLLARGLGYEPDHPALLNRLIALTRLSGARRERARALLNDLLAQGHDSAMLHHALGSDAVAQGQLEQARIHFERAWAIDPGMPRIANNLAWLLAFGDRPDEARAQALIDAAILSDPHNLHFRDTRGQIHAKMGRWKEAVADLEAALPALPDPRRTHAALAQSYSQLGMEDLAVAHRRCIEALDQAAARAARVLPSDKSLAPAAATRPAGR